MGGPAGFDQLQRLIELGLRIMGQGQHDIAADVLEPGPLCRPECGPRLFGGVGAAQRFELAVPRGLDPEGDAVDARFPEGAEGLLRDRLRVGLQGDLCAGQGRRGFHEPGRVRRVQQTGGAAAEIEGIRPEGSVRCKAVQLPQKGVHVSAGYAPLSGCGIEIAVPAFGKTVWNMQIKSKRHEISLPFS